ncbi:hypothetical protein PR001_g18250 [Phytophthora rubi]|uniref:Crinkler effector protein N-terminal domain-containing protein n=1 Tax=Phytophthora rubi TaxID=129364 RepID=A0A6A3K7N3_9STRA|nr:hypothetical protein PR001_g18250 [Phytophthora rubi]
MVEILLCYAVVGEPRAGSGVKIDDSARVWQLKEAIASNLPGRLKCTPVELQLFLGKKDKGCGPWLTRVEVMNRVVDTNGLKELDDEWAPLSCVGLSEKEVQVQPTMEEVKERKTPVHLLVMLPNTLRIDDDKRYAETISSYMKIADRLKNSEEVESLSRHLAEVSSVERTAPTPFTVLENSSGTGKTQMVFNLQARGECDVFYIVCRSHNDCDQNVYSAYADRTETFRECVSTDLETMEKKPRGNRDLLGAVGTIRACRTLTMYGFILAALRGSDVVSRTVRRSDVIDELNSHKERGANPFVFFLDEFPRAGRIKTHLADGDQRILEDSLRTMRNVFRSFGLAVVISSTNGTARNLLATSDRSRDSGTYLWCVVFPSFPRVVVNCGSGIPVLLMEIIKHSRPLFAEIALKYVQDNRYSGSRDPIDYLKYLNTMAGALASEFSALKKRTDEFKVGQLCLLLCTSYIELDGKVNIIDGHFARLSEQSAFELQLHRAGGLWKDNKSWTCDSVMPSPKEDILLHLTMMGGPYFRPFDQPLSMVMSAVKPLFHFDNTGQRSNDGMRLEALTAAAIVLASHAGGFGGVAFPTFLCELLFELGVSQRGEMMQLHQVVETSRWGTRVVPFLSPPNKEWPDWLNESWMSFDNCLRTPNEDRIDFRTTSNLISVECKDYSRTLDLDVVKDMLMRIPADSAIHLIVTNTLQKRYFSAASSWKTFVREQSLQNVDFYRISKGSTLQEIKGIANSTATKADKLVLFIVRG